MTHTFVRFLAVPAFLSLGLTHAAYAQRQCPAGLASVKAAGVSSATAADSKLTSRAAAAPVAIVTGGGQATLTDSDGAKFTHQFAVSAVVNADGSAKGEATFVFPGDFSQKWGALPGTDVIHLKGDIKTASVDASGKATLGGPFVETDYSRAEGIVYREDSTVTGAPPLELVIAPDGKTFTITWCAFIPAPGHFSAEVKNGRILVR